MRQFPFFLRNGVVPGRVSLNEFAACEPVIEKLVEKSHPAARHEAVWDRAPTGNVIGLAPLYAIQPLMPLTLKPHPLGENDFDVFDGTRRLGRLYWRAGGDSWRWIISTALADPPPQGRAATRLRALYNKGFATASQGR